MFGVSTLGSMFDCIGDGKYIQIYLRNRSQGGNFYAESDLGVVGFLAPSTQEPTQARLCAGSAPRMHLHGFGIVLCYFAVLIDVHDC